MTVDLVDHAFLRRLAESAAPEKDSAQPQPSIAACREPPVPREPLVPDDPVVSALLAEYPEQWARLAAHVEAAWAAGERVVAVAGRTRGDGVSTVVRGLVHVLQQRGAAVSCRDFHAARVGTPLESADDGRPVLVDGGVWFPPGPVHRGRLVRAAFGCHAAVLVRRASRFPCPAHAAALAALGIRVLGEVVTFADFPMHSALEST
jgi:hypothetical protein